MMLLGLGLELFFACHLVGYGPASWKSALTARLGQGGYKGVYALISSVGLGLMIVGYGDARLEPVVIWPALSVARHATIALMLPAMILIVAAYVPNNAIKVTLGHPMILSVKLWAVSHLLVNGTAADLALFGGFLAWAVLAYVVSRRRDRANPPKAVTATVGATVVCVLAGSVLWAALVMGGHRLLIGVSPWG